MAYGASVKTVYETLKDLVNKDQNGFVTPSTFNRFANVAQLNIYNRLFDSIKDSKRLSRAGFLGARDKSRIKQIEEDLSYFAASKKLTKLPSIGGFKKPTDLSRVISLTTSGGILMDVTTRKPIDILYDEDKLDRLLNSKISAPKVDSPVALISENIYVYPTSVNKIHVRYYKIPQGRNVTNGDRVASLPVYGYDSESGSDTFSSSLSVDFELPEHYTSDLVVEIASLIGINLRDNDVVNYSQGEQVKNKQEEGF